MPDCSKCRPSITGEALLISEVGMSQSRIDELLLYFLRAEPRNTVDNAVEPLSDKAWEDLLQQSDRHKITPLFYYRLRTFHPGMFLPPGVLWRLRQAYLDNTGRNLRLYQNLCQVLKVLRSENIPVLVLKGAHLAELVYGDRALRFMGDLDLLVHEDDLTRVDALLLGMGCTPTVQNRVVGNDNHEFVYVMPKRDVSLEIHWSILSPLLPFAVDTDGLWKRAKPAIIAGVDVVVLCPEDLLLHLCLHAGCAHGYEPGLKLFCDLGAILQREGGDIDWDLVQSRTRAWGCGRCVYLTLRLTRELLSVALPEELLEELRPDDFDERYVALAKDQIFSRRPRNGPPLSLWPAVARFWGAARLWEKVLLLLKGLFVSRKALARLYPPPADSLRIYFYYVVRLRDLLRVYGRDAWRWLSRDREMQAFAKEGKDLTTLKDWLSSS